MKKLKTLLFAACCVALIVACSDVVDETDLIDLKSGSMYGADKSGDDKMVTVPFKADFSVWRALPPGGGEACDVGYFRETMYGEGDITHLGEITTFMTFCVEQATSMYSFSELGYFVADNGDSLFIDIPAGQVMGGSDVEGYVAHFNDTMYFMGGTGRFDGAMGKALTNAYVYVGDGTEFRTDFWSHGHLKLKKGKR
ncbi:hypothetical protein [uncultured Draconibacterium sp.]|uniref:hypothetical protein n=1 Tax=uncultured Draconibacterium sp. TaxID=1573823 RepID=UPI0029C94872|nr:hypothetical protein [uncultured Draconibacterium sp.]